MAAAGKPSHRGAPGARVRKAARAVRAVAADDAIAPALLRWYDQGQRDLPWRREVSAYRTLVSEFMLQQTVVAAAIPFFERFMRRFPDVMALAAAEEQEVMTSWSGLGYYARARNLHRAARAVVERHGGAIPADEDALRALPGIGPYTAAAIAAIAFGRRTFALDGNAARVVARLAAVSAPIDKSATRDDLRARGLAWVPAARSGDFAQAVMELGATVCLPRRPGCADCPLRDRCAAQRTGMTGRIPRKTPPAAKRPVQVAAVRLRAGGQLLLVRHATGLLAGTWMLPGAAIGAGVPARTAARGALRALGMSAARLTAVGSVRHLFTHRDLTAQVFDATVSPAPARANGGSAPAAPTSRGARAPLSAAADELWIDESRLHEIAASSLLRKQLALQPDHAGKGAKGDKRAKPP